MVLDEKFTFNVRVVQKRSKASKGVGILGIFSHLIQKTVLLLIYKSFIRPNNDSFVQKIESIQYNAALAITGSIRGSSKEKLYKELGIESLSSRRWFRRLCLIVKPKSSSCLYDSKTTSQYKHIYPTSNPSILLSNK